MTQTMQAVQLDEYGAPEKLKLVQVERPEAGAGQVLIRVVAAGVNPVDWKMLAGGFRSLTFPFIPGLDIAGIVEATGPDVTDFQPGRAVFGQVNNGGFAQYAVAPANKLALKPDGVPFEEAAAVPIGATTAWQGLFDHGHLQRGQTVLIQGAAGGVGSLAVQFAHGAGARVIGTASGSNVAFVESLGADTVINYQTTAVEEAVHDVDLVYDAVGGPTMDASIAVLKQGGTLVSIAGQADQAQIDAKGIRFERFSAQVSHALLAKFAQLMQDGGLRVTIEETYPLAETVGAMEQSKTGHGRGRIVLRMVDG